jgi:hypothetical protein
VAAPIVVRSGVLMPVKAPPLAFPTFVFSGSVNTIEQSAAIDPEAVAQFAAQMIFGGISQMLGISSAGQLAALADAGHFVAGGAA